MTRDSINRILEMREILLSFQTGFNLISVAVVCVLSGEYLRLGTLVRYKWGQVLEACDYLKLLSIYFRLCVEKDSTDGPVNLDNVGTNVLLHGCPQSCTPKPVEGLLEVNGDMTEVLLVLEMFLTNEF